MPRGDSQRRPNMRPLAPCAGGRARGGGGGGGANQLWHHAPEQAAWASHDHHAPACSPPLTNECGQGSYRYQNRQEHSQ